MTVPSPHPDPVIKGTFALYELPDGGRMLAYRPDGMDDTKHFVIPSAVMKLVSAAQNGEKINPMKLLQVMMGK